MTRPLALLAVILSLNPAVLLAQQAPSSDQMPQIILQENGHWTDRIRNPYRPRYIPPVDYSNSSRIDSLIRAGQLYLSLQDAIALAIENNLDIELQRFTPPTAGAELLRAQGGGAVRGMTTAIRQLPQGVGGPGAPLLTSVGGAVAVSNLPSNSADLATITEVTTDLNVQGAYPFATGPTLPSYDPAITGLLSYSHQTTPQTSSFINGTDAVVANNTIGNLGLSQGFATGTTLTAGFNNNRQTGNSVRSDFNPYTTGSLSVGFTQRLLQGFSMSVNRRYIHIARNEERIADLVLRQQLIQTVADVIRLYWDLVSLDEDVKVKQQALQAAQKLYEDNKSQVEVGTLAPLELKRAQAEVARSRQDLTNSDSLVLQQEVLVKNVLTRNGAADPLLRAARIVPLDHIEISAQEATRPVQDLIAQALSQRPDVAQARLQIDSAGTYLKGTKNSLLPELDVVGSFQNNGLSGETNPIPQLPSNGIVATREPDPFFLGGYGNVLQQLFQRNFPNYSIGVQLTIPLHNRVAQADVVRDEIMVRQTEVRERQIENQVRLEVENALIALQRARASYDAAVETRQLQEEALAAEQERYTVGASTSFFVIQYQRDVAQARSTEVIAQNIYAKSAAALDRAVGSTLVNNNVDVDEAYHGHVSRRPTPLPVLNNGGGRGE